MVDTRNCIFAIKNRMQRVWEASNEFRIGCAFGGSVEVAVLTTTMKHNRMEGS